MVIDLRANTKSNHFEFSSLEFSVLNAFFPRDCKFVYCLTHETITIKDKLINSI